MEKVKIELRPDKCRFVFEKMSDTLVLGTTDKTIDSINPLIMRQVQSFIDEGISVFLQQCDPYKYICFTTKEANKQEILETLRKKSYDSTQLY